MKPFPNGTLNLDLSFLLALLFSFFLRLTTEEAAAFVPGAAGPRPKPPDSFISPT